MSSEPSHELLVGHGLQWNTHARSVFLLSSHVMPDTESTPTEVARYRDHCLVRIEPTILIRARARPEP